MSSRSLVLLAATMVIGAAMLNLLEMAPLDQRAEQCSGAWAAYAGFFLSVVLRLGSRTSSAGPLAFFWATIGCAFVVPVLDLCFDFVITPPQALLLLMAVSALAAGVAVLVRR